MTGLLVTWIEGGIPLPSTSTAFGRRYLCRALHPDRRGELVVFDADLRLGREYLTRDAALERWPELAARINTL